MAVRNFYVQAKVDGRASTLGAGPQSKTGGMTVEIFQRNHGEIEEAVTIKCVEKNGQLRTCVYKNGDCIFTHITERG